jgi:hypothetical protein
LTESSLPDFLTTSEKEKSLNKLFTLCLFCISDCSTSLILVSYSSTQSLTLNDIPQGSHLSPVLSLFYNADLVERCNPDNLPASAINFVDDIHPLAISENTEEDM